MKQEKQVSSVSGYAMAIVVTLIFVALELASVYS